ncbi:MAG: helix-turn-helix domain-containing protein [Luteolibacter sp.]
MNDSTDQIGEQLQRARENAGLTLDDVVFKTRIPRSAVEALEAEDFSHFTSPVYAKSFLSQYSDFLNVDADAWLDALRPSSFIEGDPLFPLVDGLGHGTVDVPPRIDSNDGVMSMLVLLVVSCGMVFAAMKAFEFFEREFGSEPASRVSEKKTVPPAVPKPTMSIPMLELDPAPAAENAGKDAFNPAPRAIIVR